MTTLRTPGPAAGKGGPSELTELNQRSREIFRHIVETYLSTGEPVGSRNLARGLGLLAPVRLLNRAKGTGWISNRLAGQPVSRYTGCK